MLTGRVRFLDAHTVHVTLAGGGGVPGDGASTSSSAPAAEPIIADIPGLRDSPAVTTSTDLLSTPDLPPRLVVLGGGYAGLEFAAMHAAFGPR